MPIYDYTCNQCDIRFEKFASIEFRDHQVCIEKSCTSSDLTRLYHPTPSIYKTDGFYSTDNKENNDI